MHSKSFSAKSAVFAVTALLGLAGVTLGAQAQGTMAKIKSEGKMTVGTEAAFPPFEFIEDGKIVGYGKDILDYIVADMGVELVQLDLPWQGILPGVLAGKFDFVATSVSIRPERVTKYAFTVPIAEATTWAVKRNGDGAITDVGSLEDKIVGVQLASASEAAARQYEEEMKAKGMGGFKELKLYTSFPEATLALANGELDAVIQSLPNLAVVVKEQPGVFELVGAIDKLSYMGWVTRPEDTDLRDYISSKILELRDSGKLYEMQDKWFGFRMEIPDSGYLPEGAL